MLHDWTLHDWTPHDWTHAVPNWKCTLHDWTPHSLIKGAHPVRHRSIGHGTIGHALLDTARFDTHSARLETHLHLKLVSQVWLGLVFSGEVRGGVSPPC